MAETKKKYVSLDNLSLFWENVKTYLTENVDSELSTTSTKPLSNKVITDRINKRVWIGKSNDVSAAITSGAIEEGYTAVIVTDDQDEPTLADATTDEISNLFT